MFGFCPYFDWDGRVVTLMQIPRYSFLLEAEWVSGLLNAGSRIRSLENLEPGTSRLVVQCVNKLHHHSTYGVRYTHTHTTSFGDLRCCSSLCRS